MKLRVPGNFSGDYGPVPFKDGVSTRLVTAREVNHLKAVMAGVEVLQDDGETIDEVLNTMSPLLPLGYYTDVGTPAPSPFLTDWQGQYPAGYGPDAPAKEPEAPVPPSVDGEPVVPVTAPAAVAWTKESLGVVADEQGIAGLREIADKYEVKGRSINELIDGVLERQAAEAAKTE